MSLQFFGHPFSSYTQKVLIALWADETPFEYRLLEQDYPENFEELKRHSPFALFPLLLDDGRPVIETSCIIEHLQAHHPGPNRWIPDGELGRRVRLLDRFFDLHVMSNMQVPVGDKLRPEGARAHYGDARARKKLHIAYDWLEGQLGEPWAVGEASSPWPIAPPRRLYSTPTGSRRSGRSDRSWRPIARGFWPIPVVARAVDEGRPYRSYFPLGAPDRD